MSALKWFRGGRFLENVFGPRYVDVQKWCDGEYKRFTPLRAVGLAREKGHKLCAEKGLGSVLVEDVSTVRVAGKLKLSDDGRWREARACALQLREQDANLSHRFFGQASNVPPRHGGEYLENGHADA